METSTWRQTGHRLSLSTSVLAPAVDDEFPVETLTLSEDETISIAYGGETSSSQSGSGSQPLAPGQFTSKNASQATTVRQERATLSRFMNLRARIENDARRCTTRAQRGLNPLECMSDVLTRMETRLAREAGRGSSVAKSALPIVRQMARDVRRARNGKAGLAVVRRGTGKVNNIRLVRSQDAVIVKLQQQQRAVLSDTLRSVEVNLAKAISI
ncbi:MAG: hypothetical protein Tsb0019_27140 [Roseibium sp.]